jgi:probable rRNA maturation factor
VSRPASGQPIVEVTSRGGPFGGPSVPAVRGRAMKMLAYLGLMHVELSIALVDDATMRALNSRYRRKDRPTDVLSFPMHELSARTRRRGMSAQEIGAAWPHTGPLGDVILSMDTVRRQAGEHRCTLLSELTMLLAHGLLHLLGYDHRTDAEEAEMLALTRALEAAALARNASSSGTRSRSKR